MNRMWFGIVVVMACGLFACSKESARRDAPPSNPGEKSLPSPMEPAADRAQTADPPRVITRPAEKLGPLLDAFNGCVANLAALVRSTESVPVTPPARDVQECRRRFEAILAFRGFPVTADYEDYFVLAARLVDTLPADSSGPGTPSFSVQAFIEAYNAFALRNNELIGVAATDEREPSIQGSLPRSTYRDELVRLAGSIRDYVVQWHFEHRFETLGTDAPSAWLQALLPERARLFVLRTRVESRLDAFARLKCEDAGTSTDTRVSCRMLADAAGELARGARAWLDAWDARLRSASREACPACESTRGDLEMRIRTLSDSE